MRGLEIVVGALLLASGLAGPTLQMSYPTSTPDEVTGDALFPSWDFEGSARVSSAEAALRVSGAVDTQFAGNVSLELWECLNNRFKGQVNDLILIHNTPGTCELQEQDRFMEAEVQISGHPASTFYLRSSGRGSADFRLNLTETPSTTIFASRLTSQWGEEYRQEFMMDPPLVALGHNGSQFRSFQVADVQFEHLMASGRMESVVGGGARIVVEDGHVRRSFDTWNYTMRKIDGQSAEGHLVERTRFAVVNFHEGDLELGFEDVEAVLITQESEWQVKGTARFKAVHGNLTDPHDSHSLRGRFVELVGNTTLLTTPQGDVIAPHRTEVLTTAGTPLSDSRIQANLESDARRVRLDGGPVFMDGSSIPAGPDTDLTWMAKILGLALLVLGMARRLLIILVALVARKPLQNDRRRRIHELLRRQKMAHLSELHRITYIPIGSLVYHLRVLEQAKIVNRVRLEGFTVYFLSQHEFNRDELERLASLVGPTRWRICRELVESGPMTQSDLCQLLDFSQATLSRQLELLRKAGLVERTSRTGTYKATMLAVRWFSLLEEGSSENSTGPHIRPGTPSELSQDGTRASDHGKGRTSGH